MRVYFLSEKLCSLMINGVYVGLVDGFERSVELDPADGMWCSVSPCGGEYLPFGFRLNEDFLLSPPPQTELYYTEHGVAVYFCRFLRADQSLRVLRQERLGGTLLTLTLQGKLQLMIENETGFHMAELPDALENCSFSVRRDGILLSAENAFALLSRTGETLILSEGKLLGDGETLQAEIPFHDSLGHTALCEWKDGKLAGCSIRAAGEPSAATFALALFESALIGADVRPYLAENLAEKADSLKEYLGDYRSVVLTEDPAKVGLAYPRKERVYDVRYFSIEVTDGKVSNIKPQ